MVVQSLVRWHTGDDGLHCVVVTPHMLMYVRIPRLSWKNRPSENLCHEEPREDEVSAEGGEKKKGGWGTN